MSNCSPLIVFESNLKKTKNYNENISWEKTFPKTILFYDLPLPYALTINTIFKTTSFPENFPLAVKIKFSLFVWHLTSQTRTYLCVVKWTRKTNHNIRLSLIRVSDCMCRLSMMMGYAITQNDHPNRILISGRFSKTQAMSSPENKRQKIYGLVPSVPPSICYVSRRHSNRCRTSTHCQFNSTKHTLMGDIQYGLFNSTLICMGKVHI